MKKILDFLRESVIEKSSPLVYLLGLCLVLGTSASLITGTAMGIAVILVLVLSSFVISLLARFIPDSIRPIAYMVTVAFFVAVIEILLRVFAAPLRSALGIYLPLIAASGIAFASVQTSEREGCGRAVLSALGSGLSFLAVIFIMSLVREFFGQGTFFGLRILPEEYAMRALASPFGAFILLGLLVAGVRVLIKKEKKEGVK